MRKLLFLSLLVTLLSSPAFAVIKTAVDNDGQGWGNASNWLPTGVPENGDVVIIPFGFTISVKGTFYSGSETLSISVSGTLDFDPSGKLNLGIRSTLQVLTSTARITTNGTGSEIIEIGGITKYSGNLDGNKTGPIFASAATGISPSGFTAGVLPVQLTRFNVHAEQAGAVLYWSTATETNTRHFIIERSSDARNWQFVRTVIATGNNSHYTFKDGKPAEGTTFYRLKIVDHDEKITYSGISKVQIESTAHILIGPNPATSLLLVSLPKIQRDYQLTILHSNGQIVQQLNSNSLLSNLVQLDVSAFAKGSYYVVIRSKEGTIFTKAFLVN